MHLLSSAAPTVFTGSGPSVAAEGCRHHVARAALDVVETFAAEDPEIDQLRIAEGSGALAAAKALSNPLAVTTNWG
jgi:hypothetical protein